MSANGSRYANTGREASRSSSRSLQRDDDYKDNVWRAREPSGYAGWNATTASSSRSLQRDADGGYYGQQDYYAPPGPYYAYDAPPASASRSLQRDAYGSSYAPAPYYAAPYQPHDAHYAQYDNAAGAARGPTSYARDSAHERPSRRDYDARENFRARRGSRSRSPPGRRDGPSRLPLRRSPSPAPRVWGPSLQARQLPQSRSLQRDGDNVWRESPYVRAPNAQNQPSRVSVPQNSANGQMPVGENSTPGVSVPLEPNQRDPLWGNSVGLAHEPYHFPPPRRLPRVATISLVAEEPVSIENLQDRIDNLEHDKFSLKQEVDYLREVAKRLEEKAVDAMWATQEQKIYAQGRTTDMEEKRNYMYTSRKGIQEELKWVPNFSELQRYRAGELDDSEDESEDEPAMVGVKQDDTLVVNVADQEPGEIAERASDAMYVDDSVHPHEEYRPASPPPVAPPPPHHAGPTRPWGQPQPTTDSAIVTRLRLERDDASYYDDALVQVMEHADLTVAMENIDKTKLPQVNWNSPTKYDFMIQATNLPIPLGRFNQPFLPGWAWEDFDPRRLWHNTVNGAYVAPGSELWQSLALEASSLPFECRSPAQRILVCVAHLFVSSPQDRPLLPACPGETPEPNFRLLLQTNARYVPHGVRRRYRTRDDVLYTEWSVVDVAIYLRIQMCKNTKSKVKWPDLVRKAVLWGRQQDRERLESVPRTYHAPGPYKGNERSDSEVFEYLASCAFTVPQMVDDNGVVYHYVLRNYHLFKTYQKILADEKDKTYDGGVEKMDALWRLMRPHFVEPAEHEPVIRFKVISK